jgi:hypothetical protein
VAGVGEFLEAINEFLNVTPLKAHSYENAPKKTGKMPALRAFSCFVAALPAMKVGMNSFRRFDME